MCSVVECCRPVTVRGWCHRHYRRWRRHGDPLAGRTFIGAPAAWLTDLSLDAGDECITGWPFSESDGYPVIWWEGSMRHCCRVLCLIHLGSPPSPTHQAAHSCGNRGCLNVKHLRWALPIENSADRYRHSTVPIGSAHPNAKLTEADVSTIRRRLREGVGSAELAALYGVSTSNIDVIRRRQTWRHVE